jgi:HEAT repeat protein
LPTRSAAQRTLYVRRRAASEDVVSLLNIAQSDSDAWVRKSAVDALARLKPESAIDVLLEIMAVDPVSDVRWSAAAALGAIGNDRGAPGLIAALRDEDHRVRLVAARALGDLGSTVAVPALIHSLDDSSRLVRGRVASVLGDLCDRRSSPALRLALQDPYPNVRWFAAYALAAIDGPEAIAVLRQARRRERRLLAWCFISRAIGQARARGTPK